MRSCTIEISGSELHILRDSLEALLDEETEMDMERVRQIAGDMDKILFGAGP